MDSQLSPTPKEEPQPKIVGVLFMDVVAYSKLNMREQLAVYSQLTEIVGNTNEYRRYQGSDALVCRPTGDGMAVVFFSGPVATVLCAIEISRLVRRQKSIRLRMGLHCGPVFLHKDINQQPDVTGEGIIKAQRVMDGGDANHILLSQAMGEILLALGDWINHISERGKIIDKHGEELRIYNLSGAEFGNSDLPSKWISESDTKPHVRSAGFSFSVDQSKRETTTTPIGSQKPGLGPRGCGRCGMLLPGNVFSCVHCGYQNI